MNKTVTEIPKDSTEATKSCEAQAREIVKHVDEQPHTSRKEKLESTLDNTVGAGTYNRNHKDIWILINGREVVEAQI